MLSKLVYKYMMHEKFLPYLERVSLVCLYIGLVWICIVNFIFSRQFFISENAFTLTPGQSLIVSQSGIYNPYIRNLYEKFKNSSSVQENGIHFIQKETRALGLETYVQKFPIYSGDKRQISGQNVYTYIRTKRSSQKDCLLIAYRNGIAHYNITYHMGTPNSNTNKTKVYAEIITAITLMKYLATQNWLSRDVIFLGYDGDFQYGTAVRQFLQEYYYGNNPDFIRGGIIRQAIALEYKNDHFNTYALQFGIFLSV